MDWAELAQIRAKTVYRRRPQFVYFASDGEAIKIGVSTEPKRRVSELQVAHPRRLTLLKFIEGDEKALHAQFDHLHIFGEWFRPEPELLDFIEAARQYTQPAYPPPLEDWVKRQSERGWPSAEAELAAAMVRLYLQESAQRALPKPLIRNFKEWTDRLEAAMSAPQPIVLSGFRQSVLGSFDENSRLSRQEDDQ